MKNQYSGRRYLWSLFTLVAIIDLIITGLLFFSYSSIQIEKSKANSLAVLNQVCTLTDVLNDSMSSVANQIIQDSNTYSCLNTRKINRLMEAQACIKLRGIQTANPSMRYISFYNSDTKRLISSSYAGFLEESDADFYYDLLGENKNACIFRKIGSNYCTQTDKNATVYTFVFKMSIRRNSTPDIIIIDVDEDFLKPILTSLRTINDEQEIILFDSDGNIISTQTAKRGEKKFNQQFGKTDFDARYLDNFQLKSGALQYSSKNLPNRFLTYSKSEKSGIIIANILPNSAVIAGINQIAILTIILLLITLGLGWVLSKKLSQTMYAPIQKLYDNFIGKASSEKTGNELEELSAAFTEIYSKANRLEQGLISSYTDSRKLYINYLLEGKIENVRHSKEIYDRLGIDIASPYYTVILIECVSTGDIAPTADADIFIGHYALQNITLEIISKYGKTELIRTDENSFSVLLSLNSEKLPDRIVESLGTIIEVMRNEFAFETTICIGNVISSYENVNICYESTKIALTSSNYKSRGTVFLVGATSDPISARQYRHKLHSKITEFIRSGNYKGCLDEFDIAISSMENISFTKAKAYFNHVIMSVLVDLSVAFDKGDESFDKYLVKIDDITNAQNMRILKNVFIGLCYSLIHMIATNKENSNQHAAEIARKYIDQNYNNPDLSLSVISDIVGLTPAYLGKVFTSSLTLTFNDYLNNKRMKMACELLTNSKMPISKISEEVGILNTNYFYSLFKKSYGMTPSAYRKNS